MWQAVLKEGRGQCELVWPDLLCSLAQLLDLTCHEHMIRTLNSFMLNGKLKSSLEGPKKSLLTKLVFVTQIGCPSQFPFLVEGCSQRTVVQVSVPYPENAPLWVSFRSQLWKGVFTSLISVTLYYSQNRFHKLLDTVEGGKLHNCFYSFSNVSVDVSNFILDQLYSNKEPLWGLQESMFLS